MNERIHELAVIASTQTDWWDVSNPYIEKFAELIIKECVGILDDEDDYGYESRGVRNAAYRIKKRFGVEE